MVTAGALRRRLGRLEEVEEQFFIFYDQEDGTVMVSVVSSDKEGATNHHFPNEKQACLALGIPENGPVITIERSYGL